MFEMTGKLKGDVRMIKDIYCSDGEPRLALIFAAEEVVLR